MSTGTPVMVDRSTLRVLSVAGAQSRLEELLADQRPGAGWWVQITRALDDLADAVHATPGDLIDPDGFTEQIRSDAPHLMGRDNHAPLPHRVAVVVRALVARKYDRPSPLSPGGRTRALWN